MWNDDQKEKARAACKMWQGTPWAHWMRKPGVGIDCIHFVCDVMERAGAVSDLIEIPLYSDNLGRRGADAKLIGEFQAKVPSLQVIEGPYEFGDLLVFNPKISINHVAILIDGLIWHSLAGRAVDCFPFVEFQKLIRCGLRLHPPNGGRT